jgi:hypothetical protein
VISRWDFHSSRAFFVLGADKKAKHTYGYGSPVYQRERDSKRHHRIREGVLKQLLLNDGEMVVRKIVRRMMFQLDNEIFENEFMFMACLTAQV